MSNLSKHGYDQCNNHVKILEHKYDPFNIWVNMTQLLDSHGNTATRLIRYNSINQIGHDYDTDKLINRL